MSEANAQTGIIDFYTDVVLPALADRLDSAFPEFGWRRDTRGWVATNEETTHRVLGVRAERVVAHGPAPRGFLVHGGEPTLWTAYLNGGHPPRGLDFVRTVRALAERAGVDTTQLERERPRDRRADLLDDFFALTQHELTGPRGGAAREYLASRGIPAEGIESSGLGLVPEPARTRTVLRRRGYGSDEIAAANVLADGRWPGRVCGAWRHRHGRIATIWSRASAPVDDPAAKYLYLRGAGRTGLQPYGASGVLGRSLLERRELVLVEGLLDVHHFRARGVFNVVALGGTSTRSSAFEALAGLGVSTVTVCLDRDRPGRAATARIVDRAAAAARSPAILVLDANHLAPSKDPDEFLREHGPDAWLKLLGTRECGIAWRAVELLESVMPDSNAPARRAALSRAGAWLGRLPARLAVEQEDAVRMVAERCGYSPEAVERAFRARFWVEQRRPEQADVGRAL